MSSEGLTADAKAFWDTHCGDCGHDMHPMDVCSTIVGGDQNGPDYCPCALDYPALAAEYQRSLAAQPAAGEGLDVERLIAAMGGLTWDWLGWVDKEADDDPRRLEALRHAAESIAREYAALQPASEENR